MKKLTLLLPLLLLVACNPGVNVPGFQGQPWFESTIPGHPAVVSLIYGNDTDTLTCKNVTFDIPGDFEMTRSQDGKFYGVVPAGQLVYVSGDYTINEFDCETTLSGGQKRKIDGGIVSVIQNQLPVLTLINSTFSFADRVALDEPIINLAASDHIFGDPEPLYLGAEFSLVADRLPIDIDIDSATGELQGFLNNIFEYEAGGDSIIAMGGSSPANLNTTIAKNGISQYANVEVISTSPITLKFKNIDVRVTTAAGTDFAVIDITVTDMN